MKNDLPKAYEPKKYEDKIYKNWEESGLFNPDNLVLPKNAKPYTIVLPPPNITAKLHMGSAMMLAVEDLLIRHHRMKGYRALWVPGTDHAAIATQNVVEKKLLAEEKLTRHDLGRERFLEKVWEFVDETQATILKQTRKMGASLDWSREAFTLDERRVEAVKKMFVDMYEAGVIYRGERIVNWCPRCHSTLADDEVDYKEQKAKMYTFKYNKSFPFSISTTRPETKLGDTAVAVNPKDKRYKKYIGQTIKADFVGVPLKLKIIADRQVDMKFGTGALGVTPAHSAIDWQMAEANDLEIIKVINEDGIIKSGFSKFSGKDAIKAREMIVKDLEKLGLLEKEEEIVNNLSLCYRCDTAIEPLPSKQWFVSVDKKLKRLGNKSLKEKAIEVAKNKEINFIPIRFKKRYLDWMENLHDWCISRQIWFGHRIPVWYRTRTDADLRGLTRISAEGSGLMRTCTDLRGLARTNADLVGQREWDMKIYGKDIFQGLIDGTKKIEARAGRKKGEGKYWGDFKPGDIINFSLANDKTDQIIKKVKPVVKAVKKVVHFKTMDKMFKVYKPGDDYPGKTADEIKRWWSKHPLLNKRIKNYGIWVIELENNATEEIYVGVDKPAGKDWKQDKDTLDTWFSSGMWTFSTLGWPETYKNNKKSGDLKKFHPTQILETGYEIITLWVSRMIMMSLFALKEIPFENVYLHGMVLDKYGKKMSKSRPKTSIDPLDVCGKYGTDAVRLSLLIGTTPGNDLRLSEEKIAGYRNFVNKLWNICRYIIQQAEDVGQKIPDGEKIRKLVAFDNWILEELEDVKLQVTKNLDNYDFSQAGEILKDFTWNKLADWYLEVAKIEGNKGVILNYILATILKLWHPFMPFVTEVIWQNAYSKSEKNSLIITKWPAINRKKTVSANSLKKIYKTKFRVELIIKIITAVRNARAENKVEPKRKIKAIIYTRKNAELVESQEELIKGLRTGIKELEVVEKDPKIKDAIKVVAADTVIYLVGAKDEAKEKERITKRKAELEKLIKNIKAKLDNKNFVKKAPKVIVKKERERLAGFEKEYNELK